MKVIICRCRIDHSSSPKDRADDFQRVFHKLICLRHLHTQFTPRPTLGFAVPLIRLDGPIGSQDDFIRVTLGS
jgi:hypothetical protein